MRILNIIIAGVLLFTGAAAQAQKVYKHVDANGNVVFSDQKTAGSEEMTIEPIQTYTPPPLPKIEPTEQTEATATQAPKPDYKIAITEPPDNFTVQTGIESLKIEVSIEPDLTPNDKVILAIDGQTIGEPTNNLSFTLKGLIRGTHVLEARVVNEKGEVIQTSQPITIYIHRPIARKPTP